MSELREVLEHNIGVRLERAIGVRLKQFKRPVPGCAFESHTIPTWLSYLASGIEVPRLREAVELFIAEPERQTELDVAWKLNDAHGAYAVVRAVREEVIELRAERRRAFNRKNQKRKASK